MTKARNFKDIFIKFVSEPNLKGTYAEEFYKKLKIIENFAPKETPNPNELICSFLISKEYCNFLGNMHGGALATLLDCTTTLAILKADRHMRKTVSVDFGLSFLNPANLNDDLIIRSECTRIGKNLAFSDARVYGRDKLLVSYRHVKAVFKDSYFDQNFVEKINS